MDRQRLKKFVVYSLLALLMIGLGWWGVRKLDATSSAIFVADSPDGRFRCAVFCDGGFFWGSIPVTKPAYLRAAGRIANFRGNEWNGNHDSLGSNDFRASWGADSVYINYSTGCGNDRDTAFGRIRQGGQQWH